MMTFDVTPVMTRPRLRATVDTIGILLLVVTVTAGALWIAWESPYVPHPLTFRRILAAILLGGFVVMICLFTVLLWTYRVDHYRGYSKMPLHLTLVWGFGALTVYFGIASISAVDVFYHPDQTWPLLADPGVRLILNVLVTAIVLPRAWTLAEILRGRGVEKRQIVGLYAVGAVLTLLVIAAAASLGHQV